MIRQGTIQIPFRYAAGEAASRFLETLRDEGRILGTRCPQCRRVLCPARSFCGDCGEATAEWVEVGPFGTVVSWTEVPSCGSYALVRLDGADTGMLHRLLTPGRRPGVGSRVRARFAEQRSGSILDLEGFELAEEGGS
ncbi:MAG: Zn-ribbon domain-containing OB-fold protein [Thermoanaerobaculia bacterium]